MSPNLLQFARQEGLHPTLKKWERKLKTIESVLNDAEEKQLTNSDVKMWLDDLRDLAYDVEDILDEFSTAALRRKLILPTHDDDHQGANSSTSKVRGVFTACCFNTSNWSPTAIKFNISMGSKIKAITSRMEELCNQKDGFGLKDIGGKASSTSSAAAAAYQRPPTTCLPTEFAVYGRDEEKAKVLEMVLREEGTSDANFGVVPIVGMGGLGKTTLAREVYNDKAVKDFEPKAWVCVSDDFDVLGISKAILESITSKSCDLKDLNQVQLQLKDALVGRKFLLVLDDVWSKDYNLWETLRSPFKVGAPGSKVIVTTRSAKVALTMGPGPVGYYNLKLLLDEDCWSVFKKHAFQNKDINAIHNVELIRDRVVQKCRGLPLAARTLGGLLCSMQGDDEWEDILNSAIWDLSDENGILPVLKLSYHHLPSYLKRCFAYCAILPKDYEFNKKDLVLLWMAEGLIQKQEDNKQLEDLGGVYFNELLSRSIFQQSVSNESKFVMHDLVNDLAQWVSGETSFRLEESNEENKQLKMSERARHFSFISTHYNGKAKFEVLRKVERLRTLLAIPPPSNWFINDCFISIMVLSDLLLKFKKLRALSLEKYHIVELPDSIGGLIHLRYLNLSHTMIRTLPKCASSLFNLQTLILSFCCRLVKLPSKMENMSNLQHLDIRGSKLITEMPPGIKELKDLQTLSDFIVGKDGVGCALEDLKNFKFLQGDLCISRLNNVVGVDQATREAILSNKKALKVIELEWGAQFDDSCNEEEEKNVLEMLQPHTNLRNLTLKCYGGIRFPSWLGDASFSNMTVLRLERCANCTSLPSLGMLSSLKDLTIVGMKRLKSLASEFYGPGCLRPFQSLKILRFEVLQEWDDWETTEKNEHFETFPCLRELSIKKCPKLSGKLPDHLPLLEKLAISECAQLVVSLSSLPVLCKLEVDGCRRLVLCSPSDSQSLNSMTLSNISELGNWSMQGFQEVERLKIDGSEELLHLWQNEISLEKAPKELRAFNSLKYLCIRGWPNLVLFPEICFLPLLTKLKIINCYALMSLPEGMKQKNVHLESLEIDGNHSLSFMTRGQLPSSLKRLRLIECEKLQYAFADADETHTSSSSSSSSYSENINTFLERLTVSSCPSLTCLSTRDQLPATLRYLLISDCSTITTLSRGQLPSSLKQLELRRCEKLQYVFGDADETHTSSSSSSSYSENINTFLERLTVESCPSLTCLSTRDQLPATLRSLYIEDCSTITTLSRGQLPDSLQDLRIWDCPKLESITERFHNSMLLETIYIFNCENFESIPEGIHKLSRLREVRIHVCPSLVCFPEEGLPSTNLRGFSIDGCKNLKALPRGMQTLNSLIIRWCQSIKSFPEECFPTKLTTLKISNLNMYMYEQLIQRGLPKLTSLTSLLIDMNDVESFEIGMMLPTSLTHLTISQFPKLKYLSSDGFQNLTSLVSLSIWDCPNLISFPKIGLPSSLMELHILDCPMLRKRCRRDKGREWSKIAHIPRVEIDRKLIDELEEEE